MEIASYSAVSNKELLLGPHKMGCATRVCTTSLLPVLGGASAEIFAVRPRSERPWTARPEPEEDDGLLTPVEVAYCRASHVSAVPAPLPPRAFFIFKILSGY